MVDQVQIWFLLPISILPYTGLLEKVMVVSWNCSYKEEQTSIPKIILGYVNKTIVLTLDYCIKHNEDASEGEYTTD